jgi:hypothetical protein
MRRVSTVAFVLLTLLAGPTLAEVDDPHSLGRPVKWRSGFLGNEHVLLRADCSALPEGARCVPLLPAPATTSFDVSDIDTLVLPGNSASARSLLCQVVTPDIRYTIRNPDPQQASQAHVFVEATLRIQSAVLADPTLINPVTGQPYGGFIDTILPGAHRLDKMLDPLQSESVTDWDRSRFCINGIMSKRHLMEIHGLTAAQADAFFAGQITLRLGIRGSARLLHSEGNFRFSVRFLSD